MINASPGKIFTWDVVDPSADSIWAVTFYKTSGIGPDHNAT